MESVCEKNKCTGCGACEQKCPKHCILMENGTQGFIYPHINQDECIDCGVCWKSCPVNNNGVSLENTVKILKCRSLTIKEEDKSSSGGTVSTIVASFIQENGIVFASAFDEEFNVNLKRITSIDDLEKVKGSKYVQSSTLNSFREVLIELNNGKSVLFVGTPCQVAGLYSFIGKPADCLYTIDLLCAGVASPVVYKKYVESLHETYGNFDHINFRDKIYGYGFYVTSIIQNNKKKILKGADGGFSECIGKGLIRQSCLECAYHKQERVGDLTVGDYGLEHITDDERQHGANIVFVNNPKGQLLLEKAKAQILVADADIEVINKKNNSTPLNPSKKRIAPNYYNDFFVTANEKDWKEAYRRYIKIRGLRGVIRKIIPQRLYYKRHR